MQPRAPDIVKPVTPQQVLDAVNANDDPEVEAAVRAFNAAAHEWGGLGPFNVPAKRIGPNDRVRQKVVAAIAAAGWKFKAVPDQRDGDFYSVTF